ncbi:MAG TPA: hypothetical protein VF779_08885 [Pyrinomonadaceae bacterium]
MLRLRTIILLALTGLCGLGLGLLSFFKDGTYTAICLFAFPFLVALMYLVVVIDFVNPPRKISQTRKQKAAMTPATIAPKTIRQARA